MARPIIPLSERFLGRVDRSSDCWLWLGARNELGYGTIGAGGRGGKRLKAHRVAYELVKGPIPEGLEVRHTCDNPPCVRPDHLIVGTHAANMDDIAKGRHHGSRKLTTDQVRQIRESSTDGLGMRRLAAIHGVTRRTISQVRRGVNYRHD